MKKRFSFINAKYPPKFRDPNSDKKIKKEIYFLSSFLNIKKTIEKIILQKKPNFYVTSSMI